MLHSITTYSDRSQHPVEPALPSPDGERVYRRSWRSWALYDVANSAFYLTIVTGFFPLFYQGQYARLRGGSGVAESGLKQLAGANLALAAGVAMICEAALGPVLGAMADQWGGKKRFLAVFAGLGCLASGCKGGAGGSNPELAMACYVVGTIGVAGSIIFYDALLVGLARPADLDRISSAGFAFGYAGSTLLFLLNLAWVLKPAWFGLADAVAGMRVAFVSVGVWWAAITLPLLWWVPERPRPAGTGTAFPTREELTMPMQTTADRRALFQIILYADPARSAGLRSPYVSKLGNSHQTESL